MDVLAVVLERLPSVLVSLRALDVEQRMEALSVYAVAMCELMDRDVLMNSWRLQVVLSPL